MHTRFDLFMARKLLPRLCIAGYGLFMGLAAYKTTSALRFLSGLPRWNGAVYLLYAMAALLVMGKLWVRPTEHNRLYRKAMNFSSCFSLYYALLFLLWEILCLLFSVNERIKAIGVLGTVALSALIVSGGYLYAKRIAVKRYGLSLRKGEKPYRIVLASDLHLGIFVNARHTARMVEKINSLRPDLVVIAGDLFDVDNSLLDCPEELEKLSGIFRTLRAKDGIYATTGNHDPAPKHPTFRQFLQTSDIRLLDDARAEFPDFTLVGRSEGISGERPTLSEILRGTDGAKPLIVVDHRPENLEEAVRQDADLVLSGHTHRGQMFPVSLFIRWVSGKQHFYGHRVVGTTHSIITAGVGFFELPMRLGTSNEIVAIELKL